MRVILACTMLLVLTTSCTSDQRQAADQAVIAIEKNLPQLVSSLAKLGLSQWAQKDAQGARDGAKIIAKNLRTVVLPYFEGDDLPLYQAAQNVIAVFSKNIPKEASTTILVVMATVQAAVSIPETSGYMTERQRTDVVVGLTALADACERFVK